METINHFTDLYYAVKSLSAPPARQQRMETLHKGGKGMNDSELFAGFTMGALLMFLFMMLVPMRCVEDYGKQQAVDHNAASWVVDQKTGKTRFKWNNEIK